MFGMERQLVIDSNFSFSLLSSLFPRFLNNQNKKKKKKKKNLQSLSDSNNRRN